MESGYIRVENTYEKIKKAEESYRPVVIMGPAGIGKTSAVNYYLRHKSFLRLSAKGDRLEDMPDPDSMRKSIIVIDDAQWLSDPDSVNYVRGLLGLSGVWVFILTRGGFPGFLTDLEMDVNFMRITEKDLFLSKEESADFFSARGMSLAPDMTDKIHKLSKGYPRALFYYYVRLENGEEFSNDMVAAVWNDIFHYWDESFYGRWNERFKELMLSVCQYEEFTDDMAGLLSGNSDIAEVIEYSRNVTSQLIYGARKSQGEQSYRIRPETRAFFCWKQGLLWSKENITENYRRGASWYELKGDILNALKYYRLAGNEEKIKDLLIKNMTLHPGTGHYYDTREYYFALPEEEIKKVPVLMGGMSMLYDLIVEPEKSEYWYHELELFEKDPMHPKELRREARSRLAYLDIGLPHRGTKGILRIMKDVFVLIGKGDVKLPELSATGNMPSIMNGGLDFCEWSKNDNQIARFMGKPLEVLLGKYGNGLVTIALAESGYEKGTMSPYEVLTRCVNGYEAALHGGKVEMCFVSVGIQLRQHITEGQLPSAKRVFSSFKERAYSEGASQLYENIYAMENLLALYDGKTEGLDEFIKSVPDVNIEFYISFRYRILVKIRCLLAQNRLAEAIDIANFLTGYFDRYERFFYQIENELLKSIILYRMDDEHYTEHLKRSIIKAQEYHFINIFAMEGTAALTLLRELKKAGLPGEIDAKFLDEIILATEKTARAFPDYLKFIPKEKISFTKKELEILTMLVEGRTTEDICETMDISYSGLKKHNRNIYKKLGAANRAEAERRALQLGMVHR
ncbi:MAG: hypothetical protein IJ796_07945 [Lachnospiraceae bacterium]|nr:hypothetical protein [Lachnospiraceae bacterium]